MLALEPQNDNAPASFGRIVTFTWPEMRREDLDDVVRACGLRTMYPRTGAETAFNLAVRAHDGIQEGGRRYFVRVITPRVVEFLSEVVVEIGDSGPRGERENLVRASLNTARGIQFDAYSEAGTEFIEALGARVLAKFEHFKEHVQSGNVGEWAERVVIREFGGFALHNRGHSLHVRGAGVSRFDSFMEHMLAVSRGESQIQVFKTVDTDPASMASLLSSINHRVETAIRESEARTSRAKTARGVNAVVDELVNVRSQIETYRDLLGVELDRFVVNLDRAADAVVTAKVLGAFGGLPE